SQFTHCHILETATPPCPIRGDPRFRVLTRIRTQEQGLLTTSVPFAPSGLKSSRQMRSVEIVRRLHFVEARDCALKFNRTVALRIKSLRPVRGGDDGGDAVLVKLVDQSHEA